MSTIAAPLRIVTLRLTLRPFTLDDAPFVFTLLNDSDWIRFVGDRGIRTMDDARRYIEEKYLTAYARNGFGLMLVERNADRTPMGMCGLIRREGLSDVDIGFAFLPAHRGAGYALEAAQATLAQGRDMLKLKRVVAITLPENTASITLLEKLGLSFQSHITMPGDSDVLSLYSVSYA